MKIPFLVLAAVVFAAAAWRWKRLSNQRRAVAVVVFAALTVYGLGLVHLPNVEETIQSLGDSLGQWTYLLVGALAFLETAAFIGFIVPGEFTVLFGGVVAGQGKIDVLVLIAIVWAAAVAGDSVSFLLGRRLGRDFLVRHGERVKVTPERLHQVEKFFDRHGGKTILIGRFVGLLRSLGPFIAGASKMPFSRFLPFDVLGAGLWGATFVLLGYIFWQSFDQVAALASRGALALALVICLTAGVIAGVRYLRVEENRRRASAGLEKQARKPVVGPVVRAGLAAWNRVVVPAGRALRAPARFAWDRLTPGGLGLEVSALAAITVVGGYTVATLATLVSGNRRLVTDDRAADLSDSLRTGVGDEIYEVISWLGNTAAVGTAVALTVGFLLTRRRIRETVSLTAGFVLSIVLLHQAKGLENRPRQPDSLVETQGSSFPSGHATYAVAYVAIAVTLARAAPDVAGRIAIVVFSVLLAGSIGVSRVYLRAHYLSDVIAGWALGATVFAVCGIITLVVAHIRKNGRARRPSGGRPEPHDA